MKKLVALVIAFAMVFACVACAAEKTPTTAAAPAAEAKAETAAAPAAETAAEPTEAQKLKIVHCLIHTINYFPLLEAQGAEAAAKEYGCDFEYSGPASYPDSAGQIESIETAVASGADLIIVDAVDTVVAGQAAQAAIDQGVAITCSNSGVTDGIGLGCWSTDNYAASEQGAVELANAIGGKGKVALLCYGQGTKSCEDRAYGFLDKMASDYPDIEVVSVQWITASTDDGADALKTVIAAHPDVDGVFATCQDISQGMVVGIKELDMVGQVKLVGFDSGSAVNQAIRDGVLTGAIMQSPYNMGYMACKAGIEYILNGTKPEQWFNDTGILFVTKDNIDSEDAAKVMYD